MAQKREPQNVSNGPQAPLAIQGTTGMLELDPDGPDIDWQELEIAFENNSPDVVSFINLATGNVRRTVRGLEEDRETIALFENDPAVLVIDPIPSREQYRWMEEFIAVVADPSLKEKLQASIDGKGAFRRFKDVLFAFGPEKEQWFIKRCREIRTHILEWLVQHHVRPSQPPPWLNDDGSIQDVGIPVQAKCKGLDTAQPSAATPVDLRHRVHEAVESLSFRDLHHALSYLEYLRLHRLGHFPRTPGQARRSNPPEDPTSDEEDFEA